MLTVLRKMRRSLIDAGSSRKYFIYAVGEILLVVIGILIALQVNNWNQHRQQLKKEQEVLYELKQSIEINLEALKNAQKAIRTYKNSSEVVIDHLTNQYPYHDSLNYHLARAIPIGMAIRGRLSYSGYKALESAGYDLLSKRQLRVEIINIFETVIPTIIQTNEDFAIWYNIYTADSYREFLQLKDNTITPVDYQSIKKEPYFRSMVEDRLRQKKGALRLVNDAVHKMENVLVTIQESMDI